MERLHRVVLLRGPGWRGDFEGQRDWSLIYIELPCMLIGFPLITLLTWSRARAALRDRAGRAMRNVVSGVIVVLTLVLLASASHMWLTHRIESLTWLQQGE